MKTELQFGHTVIPAKDQVRISTLNALNNPERLDERIEFLSEEINVLNPDILCLQEVIFDDVDGSSASLDTIADKTNLKVSNSLLQTTSRKGVHSGIAILSSMETVKTGTFHLYNNDLGVTNKNAMYSIFMHPNGSAIIAITAHLHWGGDQEYGRLIQLSAINRKAKELFEDYKHLNPIIVLGGDFNAVPTGDAIRFMTGKGVGIANDGAYWIDAWELLGNADNEYTSLPLDYWNQKTALANGIVIPELLPKRRIDYLLSFGWTYGSHGSPLTFAHCFGNPSPAGLPISDHIGLTADYWVDPTA